MADTIIQVPKSRGAVAPIIQAAGYSVEDVEVCPGRADPGCLVALNLEANLAASAVVQAQIDPNQAIIPLSLFLAANANLTFQLSSGQTNKTIHPEGTSSNGTWTPGDFSAARAFAQMNVLPFTGPVTRDRPLTLTNLTNANGVGAEATRGVLIGIATDKKGRIPEAAVRYHLARWRNQRPDVISLCASGYRTLTPGYVAQPIRDYCDGIYPPGSIVPYQLVDTVLGVGGTAVVQVGPLQSMVPIYADFTGSGDTLITIDDPQTGKQAQIEGGALLGNPAATGTAGSLLSPNYTAVDFAPGQFQSGFNQFPWTQVGLMSRERSLDLNISSAAGATFQGIIWAMVLDEDGNVPKEAWNYANQAYGGNYRAA